MLKKFLISFLSVSFSHLFFKPLINFSCINDFYLGMLSFAFSFLLYNFFMGWFD